MKLVARAIATSRAADEIQRRRDFRRATRNMALAVAAVEGLLAELPPGWADAHRGIPCVVGTDHGELETTIAFLKTLGETGVARPFLFQSSLHNATLGFLSERFGLTGPGFTVSPAADALAMAEDCLQGHPSILVVTVDGRVAGVEEREHAEAAVYEP